MREKEQKALKNDFIRSLKAYTGLLKTRVMSLALFTAITGLCLAPGHISFLTALIAILCIGLGGGAAGALNMWYDADIDAIMKRTCSRPIPSGEVTAQQALVFGLILTAIAVCTMGYFINWFSAFFLAFTIFYYVVIYTIWLKRRTPQNIVIGGAAGAFPPMIGWAAVTGSTSFEAFVLFLIIFLWTPPHFWSLCLFVKTDYGAANVPMLPNVVGIKKTQKQIFFYSLLLACSSVLPYILHFASAIYGVLSFALSALFVQKSYALLKASEEADVISYSKKLFFYSVFYLFAIFILLLGEAIFKILFA